MILLEVCVDSAGDLYRAQDGGAKRIELCSRLDVGGLSPTAGLLEIACGRSQLPLAVMVRPRAGDFVYDAREFAEMRREIAALRERKVAGVVFGVLRADRTIDLERVRELVQLARPMKVTFHRAFDEVAEPLPALEQLIEARVDRVLTSGGAPTAFEGRHKLGELVRHARGRIVVIAAGRVRAHDWRDIVRDSGVPELHSSTPFALDGRGNLAASPAPRENPAKS